MDRKNFYLGILSLSATVLALALYFADQPAQAQMMTIKDRDFSLVTARTVTQGDALYVLDNGTGKVVIFYYDPSRRVLAAEAVADLGGQVFGAPQRPR